MSDFTITRVSSQPPRQWAFTDPTGNNVPMESYKIMMEGVHDPVELSRKSGNAPKVGEVLSGDITEGKFGKRFKTDRKGTSFAPGTGKRNFSNETSSRAMYTAYAKDVAIAVLETTAAGEDFNQQRYDTIIKKVASSGDYLYEHAALGLSITKDIDTTLEGKGRVEDVFGKTEPTIVDLPDDF